MQGRSIVVDGNEACASVAYKTNEVIAIYPITPASPMGELADAWAAEGQRNLFGSVPRIIEMQSEAGAAGALHGALQTGALCTTFTASQGLLLMLPNMFKIAGELTPAVFHIAARTIATHALSIFGDHSDVMAARTTGWAMLASSSVQEAQDFALIALAATLESRVPFLHFFDGFRTSHEVNRIEALADQDIRSMMNAECIRAHRERGLDPDRPVLRGSAQNPDVFFQAREAVNTFYLAVPGEVTKAMERLASLTGRRYGLFEYVGHPQAERVVVMMGSGVGAAEQAIEALNGRGERVGLVKVRLYRPFDGEAFVAALPGTCRRIAVLDRTKEPGALGEPLYQDVLTALAENKVPRLSEPFEHGSESRGTNTGIRVIGGRYGLASKEFTPAMVAAIFDELRKDQPKRHFTVGIRDDVTHLSLRWDEAFTTQCDGEGVVRAIFYGLGSDGTVGANKNSVKIIGEYTDLYAQGYFEYDSRKSGAVTVSHLRFGKRPIRSTYLIQRANFVACHQFHFLERVDVLERAEQGATFLLNSPFGPDEVWGKLPPAVQRQIVQKHLRLFVVDGHRVASEAGLGGRINTVMQPCFFALANILPKDEAVGRIKDAIRKTYERRGDEVVQQNLGAVDHALRSLHEVKIGSPGAESSIAERLPAPVARAMDLGHLSGGAVPDFVQRVTAMMIAGRGELLPVSAMPVDGTFPTGTAKYEKRSIAREIPIWEPELCIDCGLCVLTCPHSVIRSKIVEPAALDAAPAEFKSKLWAGKEYPRQKLVIQTAPDDCTGCGICVEVCPAKEKAERGKEKGETSPLAPGSAGGLPPVHKALNMARKRDHLDQERAAYDFFTALPEMDRSHVRLDTVKGLQLAQPLFEFPSACAGCGETPYLKLLTQLFGDRILVANATGCSSIFGGNLPTTPWSCNREGRGPAWCNSLFEDNAEFGLGMKLALDAKLNHAQHLLEKLIAKLDGTPVDDLLHGPQETEEQIAAQRARVAALRQLLRRIDDPAARELDLIADVFVRRSVWIIGGDGWAYDIGFGGLDHVLASGHNVNILVLDTEVYSNTGGQASKATPRAAVAKFAAGGKAARKKDLGVLAMAYGNVYVAQIALGANPQQTVRAFREAVSFHGPSLIIAYCHCIAHGIEIPTAMHHQKDAVDCGYWPLYRYDPRLAVAARGGQEGDGHPMHLDSRKPKESFREFAARETRFSMLQRANPEEAARLIELAQQDIDERWRYYEQVASMVRSVPQPEEAPKPAKDDAAPAPPTPGHPPAPRPPQPSTPRV